DGFLVIWVQQDNFGNGPHIARYDVLADSIGEIQRMDWLDFAILSDLLIVFIQRTLYDTVECLKHLSDCIWSTSTAPKGFQSLTSWTHIVVHYLECTNIVLGSDCLKE